MAVETLFEDAQQKKRLRKLLITILIAVVLIHVGAGIVAGVFVVARYLLSPPATFQVQKDIRLAPKERENKMNMAEFDAMTPKPSFNDKLQSLRPTDFALPDLPKIPMDQMLPLDPSQIISDQVSSMVGTSGLGAGGEGGGAGGGGMGSEMSFFGIKDSGKSVVIVVDTSNSMFERTSKGTLYHFDFKTIKDQAIELIKSLSINTRFNVIVYEGGSMAFTESNLPATDQNKAAAEAWISELSEDPAASIGSRAGSGPKLMEGGGTRLDTAMKQTFQMKPEVVFLITDGEINRGNFDAIPEREMLGIIKDLQAGLPEPARIHVIHYLTSIAKGDEVATLRAVARRNDGRFRQVKADQAKSR